MNELPEFEWHLPGEEAHEQPRRLSKAQRCCVLLVGLLWPLIAFGPLVLACLFILAKDEL